MRLFIAINIPETVQDKIAHLYSPEQVRLRWTPLHQLHLTLVFIGEQPQDRMDEIIDTIAEISFPEQSITITGSGYFKSGIAWLGVQETPELLALQRKLYRALSNIGVVLENRRFKPHITLARCKQISPELAQSIELLGLGFNSQFSANSFELISSYLKPEGVDYQCEAEFFAE